MADNVAITACREHDGARDRGGYGRVNRILFGRRSQATVSMIVHGKRWGAA